MSRKLQHQLQLATAEERLISARGALAFGDVARAREQLADAVALLDRLVASGGEHVYVVDPRDVADVEACGLSDRELEQMAERGSLPARAVLARRGGLLHAA